MVVNNIKKTDILLNQNPMGKSLKYAKELDSISDRSKSNHIFKHYTSLYNASRIIDGSSFHFSNMSIMNDSQEVDEYGEDSQRIFSLCFCDSKNGKDGEKIPLWYMYSGIDGAGCSINFTGRVMLDFINSIDEVSVLDHDRQETGTILKKDDDFSVDFGWVYYLKDNRTIKFRGKYYSVNKGVCKDFHYKNNKKNTYIKAYPWEYEKEFRIVIKTKDKYDYLKVAVPSKILDRLSLTFGPETKKVFSDQWKRNRAYKRLKALHDSGLDISMKLWERNIKNINDYLKQTDDKNEFADEFIELIQKIKQISL